MLAFIVPIGIDHGEVKFTQTGHERDFPHNCLYPKAVGHDTDVTAVSIFG